MILYFVSVKTNKMDLDFVCLLFWCSRKAPLLYFTKELFCNRLKGKSWFFITCDMPKQEALILVFSMEPSSLLDPQFSHL